MKAHPILLAILAASLNAFGAEPGASIELYGAKAPALGVKLNAWGDCKPAERRPEGGLPYLEIAAPETAKQWCGTTIAFSQGLEEKEALSKDLIEKGLLTFKVNGGNDEFDRPSGGQNVQIAIGQQSPAKSGGYHPLSNYLEGNSVDNDPESWQEVRIPLKTLIGDSGMKRVDALKVQFIGTPPGAPLLIREIRLTPGPRD